MGKGGANRYIEGGCQQTGCLSLPRPQSNGVTYKSFRGVQGLTLTESNLSKITSSEGSIDGGSGSSRAWPMINWFQVIV